MFFTWISIAVLMYRTLSVCVVVVLLASGAQWAHAQDDPPRATVVIVGDADRFNIGQQGYCGPRTEIDTSSGKSFRIPSGKWTNFFVRSYIKTPMINYTCEGDHAFIPSAGLLHIIRYAMVEDDKCKLEIFRSEPGGTPVPVPVLHVPGQLCIGT